MNHSQRDAIKTIALEHMDGAINDSEFDRQIKAIISEPTKPMTDEEIAEMNDYMLCSNSAQFSRGDRSTGFLWGFKACEKLINKG